MEALYEVQFEYTYEMFNAYNHFYLEKIRKVKVLDLIGWIVVVLYALYMLWVGLVTRNSFYFLLGGVVVIGLACLIGMQRRMRQKRIEQTWNSSKTYTDGLMVTIKFFEDYLVQETTVSTMKVEYDKLYKCYENEQLIFMFIAENQAIILVKDKCSDENIAFLRNKLQIL